MRKHSVKNAGKFKMAPVNFEGAEEFCVKNGDLFVKMLKNVVIFQKLSLKLPPKIHFCKVVLKK